MSECGWTKGPWYFEEGTAITAYDKATPRPWYVASVHKHIGDGADQMTANARLIAAAPDLAEVAQYALHITEDVFEGKIDPVTALDAICDLAKPAMARARGEAQ